MASLLQKTTEAAHSAFASLASATQIKEGDAVPNVEVKVKNPDTKINLSTLEGKNVVVLVPAAFSPSCSETHVPGYVNHYDQFVAKGVKDIYVLSVNDIFCQNAWKKQLGADKLQFVADDAGHFASGTGLIFDASALLGGPRAKRAALVIENGKVTYVAVEQSPPEVTVSAAENVINHV